MQLQGLNDKIQPVVQVEREGPYIPRQETLSSLHRLIEESVKETQDLQRQFTGFEPGMDILSWHKKTDRFRYVHGETQRLKRRIRKPSHHNRLENNFTGQVFQDIAYSVCALECDDSRVVLSPEKTSELWTILYPAKKIVYHRFGQVSLKNVYVPDGILVDKSKVSSTSNRFVCKLYEYSLVDMTEEDLEKQLKAITIQHRKFPGLFAEKSVEFVIPLTFHLPKLKDEREGIEFLQLGITRVQFGHFIAELYNHMR